MNILELKRQGVKQVYLNGFIESVNYVATLSDIKYSGETRSEDGYSTIQCYEQDD